MFARLAARQTHPAYLGLEQFQSGAKLQQQNRHGAAFAPSFQHRGGGGLPELACLKSPEICLKMCLEWCLEMRLKNQPSRLFQASRGWRGGPNRTTGLQLGGYGFAQCFSLCKVRDNSRFLRVDKWF